ncbi:MAG TPA: MobA-like NTP transferase domain containing protein, partial [Marinobacter sp.]|nr:MobA-like NTP transferase domain containing protein [Marinobacter sp.]
MKNHFEMTAWSALVLAADRHENDPVAVDAGVPCKALAPVAGVPMLQRVLDAISASDRIRRITLVGPPRKWLE